MAVVYSESKCKWNQSGCEMWVWVWSLWCVV